MHVLFALYEYTAITRSTRNVLTNRCGPSVKERYTNNSNGVRLRYRVEKNRKCYRNEVFFGLSCRLYFVH